MYALEITSHLFTSIRPCEMINTLITCAIASYLNLNHTGGLYLYSFQGSSRVGVNVTKMLLYLTGTQTTVFGHRAFRKEQKLDSNVYWTILRQAMSGFKPSAQFYELYEGKTQVTPGNTSSTYPTNADGSYMFEYTMLKEMNDTNE